jgi:hypothetical protein
MNMEQWWNDIFAGETEVVGENLPSATLSTTNPTWIDPGANPGLRNIYLFMVYITTISVAYTI